MNVELAQVVHDTNVAVVQGSDRNHGKVAGAVDDARLGRAVRVVEKTKMWRRDLSAFDGDEK